MLTSLLFSFPGSESIVDAVAKAFEEHPDVKLCVFSHISSVPSIIEPVKELTALAHKFGALSLIDAAHAPGVIDIDVHDIGADYYLGNCHKWLYAPKGSAFLWVAPGQQAYSEPTVISSTGKHDFVGRYAYTGKDNVNHNPFLSTANICPTAEYTTLSLLYAYSMSAQCRLTDGSLVVNLQVLGTTQRLPQYLQRLNFKDRWWVNFSCCCE